MSLGPRAVHERVVGGTVDVFLPEGHSIFLSLGFIFSFSSLRYFFFFPGCHIFFLFLLITPSILKSLGQIVDHVMLNI